MEAVGIGCICFAVNPDGYDKDKFLPSEHLAEIERALESVDNVSNVNVEGDGNVISGLGMLDDNDDDDAKVFFPIYSDVLIEFDIFMPARLQAKYTLGRTIPGVETFHVKLRYDRMPAAYIHYSVSGTGENARNFSPSNAVIFIRKYLAEKLENHPTVKFEVLGPSPFHADLFLEPARGEATPGTARDLTFPGDGYRTFHFLTNATKPDESVYELVANYHEVLAAFYQLVRARSRTQRLTSALTGGARGLLLPTTSIRPWNRFWYWYRLRDEIDSVYGALLDEKMNRVNMASFHLEVKEDEQIPPDSIFYSFIEKEMRAPDDVPDEDIRELLIMLEERRRGYFQNTATLISGLAGGILGAVLGVALTYALSSQSTPSASQTILPQTQSKNANGAANPQPK